MGNISKELIENFRKIVLPFVSKRLYEANFEGQGETDKTEFEQAFNEILDLAISALNPSGGLTEAEKIICKVYLEDLDKFHTCNEYKLLMSLIDNAQTVEPDCLHCKQYDDGYMYGFNIGYNKAKSEFKRPKGVWIYDSSGVYCNQCDMHPDCSSPFCPNCGADMRKGGNE